MWYRNKTGQRVEIFNRRPRNLSTGGLIEDHPSIPKKWKDDDCIASRLQVGSLVVPVKVMKSGKFDEFIEKYETTGPKTEDRSKLVSTIVMPNEYVVHADHAKKAETFLKRKGIYLPLGK